MYINYKLKIIIFSIICSLLFLIPIVNVNPIIPISYSDINCNVIKYLILISKYLGKERLLNTNILNIL